MAFAISQFEMDMIIKIIVAVILGAIVGIEREFNKSAAGIKTYAIVCMGSALFTAATANIDIKAAGGVITGIGFLGAATIFKSENKVVGLTTAALIWATAAIGFAVGLGYYFISVIATIILLFILIPVEWIEKKILKTHPEKGY